MPIFSSSRETVKPSTRLPSSSRRSTRNSVIPSWRLSGSVFVTSTQKSARGALVMNVLAPLITYSSPSRIAVVRMPATSEPAPGSVIPSAADLLALDPGDEVALLLLLGAEQVDGGQDHVGLDREAHVGAARARVAHALGADQRVEVVAALPAVLLREAEAEVAELAGALHHLGRASRCPPTRCGGDASPSCTQALIDSRRSRCSSLKRKCLRDPSCVGLDDGRSRSGHCGLLGSLDESRERKSNTFYSWPSYEKIRYEVADGVATITLDDPETRNALSDQLLTELLEALRAAKADDERARASCSPPRTRRSSRPAATSAASRPTRRPPTSTSAPRSSSRSSASSASSASRRSSPPTATCSPARSGSRSPAT